jgi:hypothetical protein
MYYRYKLHEADGTDIGEAHYAVPIQTASLCSRATDASSESLISYRLLRAQTSTSASWWWVPRRRRGYKAELGFISSTRRRRRILS